MAPLGIPEKPGPEEPLAREGTEEYVDRLTLMINDLYWPQAREPIGDRHDRAGRQDLEIVLLDRLMIAGDFDF